MNEPYAVAVGRDYHPDPEGPVFGELFQQYERVIVESLISSFGLDAFISDKHGGDVDTIHNVRQIGKDPQMTYKSAENAAAYQKHVETDSYSKAVKTKYDSAQPFVDASRAASQQKKDGTLVDAYTGKSVARNANMDMDHVVSTKEIHEDPGRILAGVDGYSLANNKDNVKATDRSINRSKKEKSAEEFIAYLHRTQQQRDTRISELKHKSSLTEQEQKELQKLQKLNEVDEQKLKAADEQARKSIDRALNKAYYTSPKFAKDLTKAAGKVGVQMGMRQALGFVFAELWFAVKEEFEKVSNNFYLEDLLKAVGDGIKRGLENAKAKYKNVLEKFKDGLIAGGLSSVTTTLCNIFFTTAKNVVKIIRQTWASLVEALKILLFNPDNLPFGERMRAALKVIATGASVVVGTTVGELIGKTPLGSVPVVGEIVQSFCSAFVSGVLSCTLLYFLDRGALVNHLVASLNRLPTMEDGLESLQKQLAVLEAYAAQLMGIDLKHFQEETAMYRRLADRLEAAETPEGLNRLLQQTYDFLGLQSPWEGEFSHFMEQRKTSLVFN